MKLSQFTKALQSMDAVGFVLPDGSSVAAHYHVTEVGQVTKKYIDCGGTLREETKVTMQLWQAEDYDHRLTADKLSGIISMSTDKLQLADSEIEVEYQGAATIESYAVGFDGGEKFELIPRHTACLALDACNTVDQVKVSLQTTMASATSCCGPESNCC